MTADPRFSDAAAHLQTLQPRFHLSKPAIIILAAIPLTICASFFLMHGPDRFFYRGLAILAGIALLVQYRREHAIVYNRLPAIGVVTDHRIPGRSRYRIVRFLVRRFAPEVPIIKYSFTAYDQKSYGGETGFGARDLHKGDEFLVIYNPENPARSHPLGGFIFYLFE